MSQHLMNMRKLKLIALLFLFKKIKQHPLIIFPLKNTLKQIESFLNNQNIIANTLRIQAHGSILYG